MDREQALEVALGPSIAPSANYFDVCRRKRNLLDYDCANVATDTEAEEFRQVVEAWIAQHHPHLVP